MLVGCIEGNSMDAFALGDCTAVSITSHHPMLPHTRLINIFNSVLIDLFMRARPSLVNGPVPL